MECGLTGEVEESRRNICLCDTTSTKKLTRKETRSGGRCNESVCSVAITCDVIITTTLLDDKDRSFTGTEFIISKTLPAFNLCSTSFNNEVLFSVNLGEERCKCILTESFEFCARDNFFA